MAIEASAASGRSFGVLCAAFLSLFAPLLSGHSSAAAQETASAAVEDSQPQSADTGQDSKNNGSDLTRPQNSLDLRYQYREASGTTSRTDRDIWILRETSKIQLNPDWKLSLFGQMELVDKTTFTQDEPNAQEDFGLGNSEFQAVLIRTLSDSLAYGFGARLVAPTASDGIGNGKWLIMPGFGVRTTFTELSSDTYFVPAMRYAVSFAGYGKRNISEPQFAPTFNLDLPGPWFLTFYPSYDIRINYGDPVSGQTGRLFLPADAALGYALSDKVSLSLEVSVPIIKDYPVYDFKTEFRVVIKQ